MDDQLKKVRTEELRVKVTPDMKKRIDRIAEMHGMPSVTWANFVIAKAVVDLERQYQIQNKTMDAMVKMMQEVVEPMLEHTLAEAKLIEAEQEAGKSQAGQ